MGGRGEDLVVEGLWWVSLHAGSTPYTPSGWDTSRPGERLGQGPGVTERTSLQKGQDLSQVTEGSTAEPAPDPGLPLSQTESLVSGFGPCHVRFPLLASPQGSRQPACSLAALGDALPPTV